MDGIICSAADAIKVWKKFAGRRRRKPKEFTAWLRFQRLEDQFTTSHDETEEEEE